MIGGGHVRRRSVGSVIEASPIVRAVGHLGKRKNAALGSVKDGSDKGHVRIIEKASIDSTSSSKFGGERMIRATKGLLERQSLEESCLIAEGEDLSASCEFSPQRFKHCTNETIQTRSRCSRGQVLPLDLVPVPVHRQVLASIHPHYQLRMVPRYRVAHNQAST